MANYLCPICGEKFSPPRQALSRYLNCYICSECGVGESVERPTTLQERLWWLTEKTDAELKRFAILEEQLHSSNQAINHWYRSTLKLQKQYQETEQLRQTVRVLLQRVVDVTHERNWFMAMSLDPAITGQQIHDLTKITIDRLNRQYPL